MKQEFDVIHSDTQIGFGLVDRFKILIGGRTNHKLEMKTGHKQVIITETKSTIGVSWPYWVYWIIAWFIKPKTGGMEVEVPAMRVIKIGGNASK